MGRPVTGGGTPRKQKRREGEGSGIPVCRQMTRQDMTKNMPQETLQRHCQMSDGQQVKGATPVFWLHNMQLTPSILSHLYRAQPVLQPPNGQSPRLRRKLAKMSAMPNQTQWSSRRVLYQDALCSMCVYVCDVQVRQVFTLQMHLRLASAGNGHTLFKMPLWLGRERT